MPLRQNDEHAERKQDRPLEGGVARQGGDGEIDETPLDLAQEVGGAVLAEKDLDIRTEALVSREKTRHEALESLWCCAKSKEPTRASGKLVRVGSQRLCLPQKRVTAGQEVVAGRGQLDLPADSIEEPDLELTLEGEDLLG